MKKYLIISTITIAGLLANGCHDQLNPEPIDLVVNDVVLNEPKDIEGVEIGLYRAFRLTMASTVLAGDLTADNLIHNGTFAQYREIAIKQITTGNATVSELWGTLYGAIYIANFMIERIPTIEGVTASVRKESMATAYFIRGLCYFRLAATFGGVPKVTTTDIETNRNIARATKDEIMALAEADFLLALGNLGGKQATPATACDNAVNAALARFYLYKKDYNAAIQYSTAVINSNDYVLEEDYVTIITKDFTDESIFEVGYTISDDGDGTSLNDLFVSRREMIPSNNIVPVFDSLANRALGRRNRAIKFKTANLKGTDNGWEVANYGTAVDNNNNIVVFRLAEMYLIRAEARAILGNVGGINSAQSDITLLRKRANFPRNLSKKITPKDTVKAHWVVDTLATTPTQAQMISLIEVERRMELSYEGHRWYDLVRTGRVEQVMPPFNSNWKAAYELWPIPQREIQNNPALAGEQNPGY
ncbi:MAG: RagB/SusD family nutrient uptake outer membrane protein [Bacteroidota bacterium]